MITIPAGVAGVLACALASCHASAPVASTPMPEPISSLPVIGDRVAALPHAIVYQVSGDDCMDLVPITLTADGKGVLSYPAPTDLNVGQTPIDLGDGWWLDRRGIGPTSVFTTYTYEEYEAMSQAPSVAELLAHIDHKAHITRMYELPISVQEADSDPAVVRAYTESGFVDCTELLDRP